MTENTNTLIQREYVNPELVRLLKRLGLNKVFVEAQGCLVWDLEGNEYLDCLGAFGAMNTGHNHPRMKKAMQLVEERPNLLQTALNPLAGALANNLAMITPGDLKLSFFTNSGAEAVDCALKMARAASGKTKIIACKGSYHGKTVGADSVTEMPVFDPSMQQADDVEFVDYGDIDMLEEALAPGDAAAFIVEPIQGENGIILPPEGYMREVQNLCRSMDTLLIADEIQTGLGRTGKMFACNHEHVKPDIMCLGKSLGGGVMPISACISTEQVWKKAYGNRASEVVHASTFGGNTRAAAAAMTALEIIWKERLSSEAGQKGAYLLDKLEALRDECSVIREVRGRGLMIGIELSQGKYHQTGRIGGELYDKLTSDYLGSLIAGELFNKFRIITAYTLKNPNVIRIEPPLTISYDQMDQLVCALEEICKTSKGILGALKETQN